MSDPSRIPVIFTRMFSSIYFEIIIGAHFADFGACARSERYVHRVRLLYCFMYEIGSCSSKPPSARIIDLNQ